VRKLLVPENAPCGSWRLVVEQGEQADMGRTSDHCGLCSNATAVGSDTMAG
jgi:hypothetical protein